jgi:hypothetical protein
MASHARKKLWRNLAALLLRLLVRTASTESSKRRKKPRKRRPTKPMHTSEQLVLAVW